MSKQRIAKMDTQHLVNRIAWVKRQQVEPYDVMGDYFQGGYTRALIQDDFDMKQKEIDSLETELNSRLAGE